MQSTEEVGRKVLATMDSQDYEALREVIAEDVKMTQGGYTFDGIDQVIEMLKAFYGALPDLEHRVMEATADEEGAAFQMNVVATHDGPFTSELGEFPPTGKQTSWYSSTFMAIEDGKAVRIATYLDVLAVHVELGYEPTPHGG